MNREYVDLLVALVFAIACLGVELLFLFRARKVIGETFTIAGWAVACGVVFALNVQIISWICGLLPPLNNPLQPEVLGVGGAAYGMDYSDYLVSAALLNVVPITMIAGLWFCASPGVGVGRCCSLRHFSFSKLVPRNRLLLYGIGAFVAIATALEIIAIGVDYLGEGPNSSAFFRREAGETDSSTVLGKLPILSFLLPLSAAAAPLLGGFLGGRERAFGIVVALIGTIIPLVHASRSFGLVALGIAGAVALRSSGAIHWKMTPLAIVVGLLGFSIPLETRGLSSTGVGSNIENYFSELDDERGVGGRISTVLANVSLSFPIFVETYGRQPNDIELNQLPLGYRLKMLSPTPGAIDGFGAQMRRIKPRVNPYTPYSGLSEAYGLYGVVGFLCVGLSLVGGIWLLRILTKFGCGEFVVAVVGALILFYWMQILTYDLRTATRFFYLAIFVTIAATVAKSLGQTSLQTKPSSVR